MTVQLSLSSSVFLRCKPAVDELAVQPVLHDGSPLFQMCLTHALTTSNTRVSQYYPSNRIIHSGTSKAARMPLSLLALELGNLTARGSSLGRRWGYIHLLAEKHASKHPHLQRRPVDKEVCGDREKNSFSISARDLMHLFHSKDRT